MGEREGEREKERETKAGNFTIIYFSYIYYILDLKKTTVDSRNNAINI